MPDLSGDVREEGCCYSEGEEVELEEMSKVDGWSSPVGDVFDPDAKNWQVQPFRQEFKEEKRWIDPSGQITGNIDAAVFWR